MMNEQQIAARLVELHAALVAKLGKQPWMTPYLYIEGSGRIRISIHTADVSADCQTARGTTFAECFDAAFAIVANMPTPETAALHRHMKMLADVVDHGMANNIADEYVDPARVTIKAMTDNLLPVQIRAPAEMLNEPKPEGGE
jgi:hypothetical protein